ncbi:hypothetical protein L484_011251 [Morus notabilis]|uniref:Uncharacterized protein n=1 Tax=Morus notabilis TaxID=981085 RepID=W9RUM0_9ROSA|nr:hypothetical protein L484_011251 [Morus notabilis]
MGKQHRHSRKRKNNLNGRKTSRDDKISSRCCCPCSVVSSMVRGIARCMFVTCYPVIQCFGLDDHRHRHRHHHHKHFF